MRCLSVTPLLFAVTASLIGCGASLTAEQARGVRQDLRTSMGASVTTREQRDQHSRQLADAADRGALDGMSRSEMRAAFGSGRACRIEICSKQGFGESDWYYEIGVAESDDIKQLPLLIVAFDDRDRATRVYTLTTH
ncbi:MAG: hypothetical protein OEZ06_04105 [Myxococcales bacterium]|nr:hypothetical protein [Myxococcales bacterium]